MQSLLTRVRIFVAAGKQINVGIHHSRSSNLLTRDPPAEEMKLDILRSVVGWVAQLIFKHLVYL